MANLPTKFKDEETKAGELFRHGVLPAFLYNILQKHSQWVFDGSKDLWKYIQRYPNEIYSPYPLMNNVITHMLFDPKLVSAHLLQSILYNVFSGKSVSIKDYESFYRKQLASYLSSHKRVSDMPSQAISDIWESFVPVLESYKNIGSKYEKMKAHSVVHFTDGFHNYAEVIPLLGKTADLEVDIHLVVFKDMEDKLPKLSMADLLDIPSVAMVLGKVLADGHKINQVWITYINHRSFINPIRLVKNSWFILSGAAVEEYLIARADSGNYHIKGLDLYPPLDKAFQYGYRKLKPLGGDD